MPLQNHLESWDTPLTHKLFSFSQALNASSWSTDFPRPTSRVERHPLLSKDSFSKHDQQFHNRNVERLLNHLHGTPETTSFASVCCYLLLGHLLSWPFPCMAGSRADQIVDPPQGVRSVFLMTIRFSIFFPIVRPLEIFKV